MLRFQIEENISRISLVLKIIKYNFLRDRYILFKEYRYGKNKRQYYHVYNGVDNSKPIIFFIHGGGWWHGSPRMCRCIAKYFYKKGYTVVLPAYRLVPEFKYPTQIEDVFNALKHYISRINEYKKRGIIVMGFSAGGELAANIVFNKVKQKKWNIDKSIFKGFISFSGVLDFNKCTSKHSKTLIKNYLGKKVYPNKVNPISLLKHSIRIPVLCIHGDRDPLINIDNSFSFINRIMESGGKGMVQVVKEKHHSDIIELIIGKGQKESVEMFDFISTCQ